MELLRGMVVACHTAPAPARVGRSTLFGRFRLLDVASGSSQIKPVVYAEYESSDALVRVVPDHDPISLSSAGLWQTTAAKN